MFMSGGESWHASVLNFSGAPAAGRAYDGTTDQRMPRRGLPRDRPGNLDTNPRRSGELYARKTCWGWWPQHAPNERRADLRAKWDVVRTSSRLALKMGHLFSMR